MPDYRTIPPTVEGPCRYSLTGKCCVTYNGKPVCPDGICAPPTNKAFTDARTVDERTAEISDLEFLKGLQHNIHLFADAVPHIDLTSLKRELRRQNHKLRSLISRIQDR